MKPILLILSCLLFPPLAWSNSDQALQEIEKLIRLRDYPQVASRLIPLAQQGNPEAQYRLAGLYRSGKGVARDLKKATNLYHDSARAGHAGAQYAFGLIIEKANGSLSSQKEARRWYRKSAAQGNERARLKLAQLQELPEAAEPKISRSDIFNAIQHNDEALIDSLISRGVDLNLSDRQGNTTVLAALLAGWPRLAGTLISRTKDPGQANIFGNRSLHVAAARGYRLVVIALLDNGVDIDQTDARGDTALMLAVKNENTDIAELLLKRGADYSLSNNKQRSAVDLAYADDNPGVKTLFASRGIRPTAVSGKKEASNLDDFKASVQKHGARYAGWPLLNIAIEIGESSISEQLIAARPDLGATGPDGNSALHVAARKGDPVNLKKILNHGASINALNQRNETALYLAAESACLQCVSLLVNSKADPSIATKLETTPLEAAVQNDQPGIAMALLQNKSSYASIHRVLLMAIEKRMESLSYALIKRDRQLGAVDEKQRTVLWHSVDQGLEKTTQLLIASRQIDINRQDINGHSPLTQAVIHGHFEIARLLIDHGADLATRTNEGSTLVMLAVLSKNSELVEFLLNRAIETSRQAVDINAQDNVGETALMLAAATAQDRIIELLLHAGADPQLRNKEDLNAFQIATNAGHADTAKFIHDKSNFVFKLFN